MVWNLERENEIRMDGACSLLARGVENRKGGDSLRARGG